LNDFRERYCNATWWEGRFFERHYRLALSEFNNKWGLDRLRQNPANDYVDLWSGWDSPPEEFSTAVLVDGEDEPDTTEVTFAIDVYWDPFLESPTQAEARILRDVNRNVHEHLERAAESYELFGFIFPDTAGTLARNLDWMFRLCTKRARIPDLADEEDERAAADDRKAIGDDAIVKAMQRLAEALDLRADDGLLAMGTDI
jgi:hypothetical protein